MAGHVVITGSTRGFGFAMAKEFLNAGWKVALSGRSDAGVTRAAAGLTDSGNLLFLKPCDVTSYDQVSALWKEAASKWGRIDIWINNAGVSQPDAPVWDIPALYIDALVKTNILGVVYGSRIAFNNMVKQGFGAIYNLEGWGSDGRHMDNLTLYGTSKCAVAYFTEGLVQEAKNKGVIVGTIQPGMMVTDFVLLPMKENREKFARFKKILNIIADKPETVAAWLVPRLIRNKKHGTRFRWMSGPKLLSRFITAPLSGRKVI
ncbi:MAG: SDR family oxidoreductase [Spirochaetales bacterium]|nr:SDR family oxidoreductase [Spirochaetales bacterium]